MARIKLWAYWDHAPSYKEINVCELEPIYHQEHKFFHSVPHTLMQIESPMDQSIFSTRICPGLEPGKALEFEIEI